MKKVIIFLCSILTLTLFALPTFAHPGKTDSQGGHNDRSSGDYHYHHGYPAHYHDGGVCPYDFDDQTDHSSSESSSSSSSSSNNSYSSSSDSSSSYSSSRSDSFESDTNSYKKESNWSQYSVWKKIKASFIYFFYCLIGAVSASFFIGGFLSLLLDKIADWTNNTSLYDDKWEIATQIVGALIGVSIVILLIYNLEFK